MSANAKAPPKGRAEPLDHGVGVCPLVARRYQPQPVRFIVAAADDAETELGEPAELLVVAVPEGRHPEALERIRKALG